MVILIDSVLINPKKTGCLIVDCLFNWGKMEEVLGRVEKLVNN